MWFFCEFHVKDRIKFNFRIYFSEKLRLPLQACLPDDSVQDFSDAFFTVNEILSLDKSRSNRTKSLKQRVFPSFIYGLILNQTNWCGCFTECVLSHGAGFQNGWNSPGIECWNLTTSADKFVRDNYQVSGEHCVDAGQSHWSIEKVESFAC